MTSKKTLHALVCGASSGIGEATSYCLAQKGYELTLLARSKEKLEKNVKSLLAEGASDVHVLVANLDKRDEMKQIVSNYLKTSNPIHIWINNTGGPPGGLLKNAQEEELYSAFGRHLFASQTLLQLLLPSMVAEGYGRIINVLSTSVRQPIPNLGVSNTVRAAMASWAKTLSSELPPGVTINSILPGFTATERLSSLAEGRAQQVGKKKEEIEEQWIQTIPEGRLGEAKELGQVIAFIASPEASYVRGVCIPVDGGRLTSI